MAQVSTTTTLTFDTTRFGPVTMKLEDMLMFPEGLIGFSQYKKYALLPHAENSPFFWLQCVDNPSVAFPVVDPSVFITDYKVAVRSEDIPILQHTEKTSVQLMTVMTIPKDKPSEVWLNLQGPILVNTENNMARQIIMSGPDYPLRFKVAF